MIDLLLISYAAYKLLKPAAPPTPTIATDARPGLTPAPGGAVVAPANPLAQPAFVATPTRPWWEVAAGVLGVGILVFRIGGAVLRAAGVLAPSSRGGTRIVQQKIIVRPPRKRRVLYEPGSRAGRKGTWTKRPGGAWQFHPYVRGSGRSRRP